eukprot:3343811-Amphidinium_carterae.1
MRSTLEMGILVARNETQHMTSIEHPNRSGCYFATSQGMGWVCTPQEFTTMYQNGSSNKI